MKGLLTKDFLTIKKKNAYRLNAASHNIMRKSGLLDR